MSPRARLAAAAAGLVLAAAAGCGEKIAIPRPEGLFSVSAYILDKRYAEAAPLQIAVVSNNRFVRSADGALVKRDRSYGEIVQSAGQKIAAKIRQRIAIKPEGPWREHWGGKPEGDASLGEVSVVISAAGAVKQGECLLRGLRLVGPVPRHRR